MSTEYGFRCRTHSPHLSSSHNLREYVAQSLLAKRREIPILQSWDADMLISFGADNQVNYGVGEAVTWLGDHPNCDVVLEDEYGHLPDVPDTAIPQASRT